jgi:hypothetical protein
VKNESYKLIRDVFHALSIGAFAAALFGWDALLEYRLAAMLGGFYAHLLAHLAVLYDRKHRLRELLRERREEQQLERMYPTRRNDV